MKRPSQTEGARTAEWRAHGSEFDVSITSTALGNGGMGTITGATGLYEKRAL